MCTLTVKQRNIKLENRVQWRHMEEVHSKAEKYKAREQSVIETYGGSAQ